MDMYLIMVIALFILAMADLFVGVANDAVNFLNSAIGSKAGSIKWILLVAAFGILVGTTFSNGMMEVARKGFFNPDYFSFNEVMIIFVAMMIANVFLIDVFNSLGLPTSTTVSLIFNILGAAVAVSLMKISNGCTQPLGELINSSKALGVTTSILLSVLLAFTTGAIVQYFARILFSFDFVRRLKYLAGIWGGIAITAITYYMFIIGIKDSSFASYLVMGKPLSAIIQENSYSIILYSFIGWSVIMQVLYWLKVNTMKVIVLIGTFALAMAFAGNDLVNFVGIPMAGYEAYNDFVANGFGASDTFMMNHLNSNTIVTPIYFLIGFGMIMVLTLYISKKAKKVIKTELDLSRQEEGEERFGSSILARSLVRNAVFVGENLEKFTPKPIKMFVAKQFDQTNTILDRRALGKNAPNFDYVRATVNLTVSSILISIGTANKLPLSTTYVTFMAVMGTSLADQAWGRESAVYRITGVLSVIGGWFFTAFAAFALAFILALAIWWGGPIIIFLLFGLVIFHFIKTNFFVKEKATTQQDEQEKNIENLGAMESCKRNIFDTLNKVSDSYNDTFEAFFTEDRKALKTAHHEIEALNEEAKYLKKTIFQTISKLRKESVETSHHYVMVLDYLREIAHCLTFISDPALNHIENNHKPLVQEQIDDLRHLKVEVLGFIQEVIDIIKYQNYSHVENLVERQQYILKVIKTLRKKHVKLIKSEQASTKTALLYFSFLHETKNLLLQTLNLLKSQRDFINGEN